MNQISNPSATTRWEAGTTPAIAWNRTGVIDANARIAFFRGGAKVFDIAAATANDGGFDWFCQ